MSEEREFAEREFGEVATSDSDTTGDALIEAHIPRVTVGPLAEPEDAWLRYRSEVAAYYGAQGPVELSVVDRIVAIQARIRRLEVAERGALTAATVGFVWRRTVERVRGGNAAWRRSRLTARGVLGLTNPVAIRRAIDEVQELVDCLVEGELPEMDRMVKLLVDVYGCEPGAEGMVMGKGGQILVLYALARTPPPESEPDGAAVAARVVAAVHEGLRETHQMLVGLMESLEDEDGHITRGAVEAKARMDLVRTRALVQLERHLQASVKEAVRELERMVARRRLGVCVRRRRNPSFRG